jgi:ribosomal protein S18 acetylase RimI-like enzyme
MIDAERITLGARVQVRHLAGDDLPALEWEGQYKHFRRLYRDVYENMRAGKALMWVVELPEVGVVGQLFVQLKGARAEWADGLDRAYVYGVRVRPSYRNQGIGSRLMEIVEADLNARGFRWINLNVGRQNIAARRFYERHGYKVISAEPGRWSYIDHRGRRQQVEEPAWRMQKDISIV